MHFFSFFAVEYVIRLNLLYHWYTQVCYSVAWRIEVLACGCTSLRCSVFHGMGPLADVHGYMNICICPFFLRLYLALRL